MKKSPLTLIKQILRDNALMVKIERFIYHEHLLNMEFGVTAIVEHCSGFCWVQSGRGCKVLNSAFLFWQYWALSCSGVLNYSIEKMFPAVFPAYSHQGCRNVDLEYGNKNKSVTWSSGGSRTPLSSSAYENGRMKRVSPLADPGKGDHLYRKLY